MAKDFAALKFALLVSPAAYSLNLLSHDYLSMLDRVKLRVMHYVICDDLDNNHKRSLHNWGPSNMTSHGYPSYRGS